MIGHMSLHTWTSIQAAGLELSYKCHGAKDAWLGVEAGDAQTSPDAWFSRGMLERGIMSCHDLCSSHCMRSVQICAPSQSPDTTSCPETGEGSRREMRLVFHVLLLGFLFSAHALCC